MQYLMLAMATVALLLSCGVLVALWRRASDRRLQAKVEVLDARMDELIDAVYARVDGHAKPKTARRAEPNC